MIEQPAEGMLVNYEVICPVLESAGDSGVTP